MRINMELPDKLKIKVPEGFEDMFKKISSTDYFKKEHWYKVPNDEKIKEFLDWVFYNLMRIDYSDDRSHFKINFFPSFNQSISKRNNKEIKHIDVSKLKTYPVNKVENKSTIPKNKSSRPDITVGVMRKFGLEPSVELLKELEDYNNKNKPFNDEF